MAAAMAIGVAAAWRQQKRNIWHLGIAAAAGG
jgi:uncharacterized protein YjiS (DUF1127 family)